MFIVLNKEKFEPKLEQFYTKFNLEEYSKNRGSESSFIC